MDSKGQGFDVFKLLIAAIVAVAILMILMNILNPIPPLTVNEPGKAAVESVKAGINNTGLPKLTETVTFSQQTSLNARTIAEQTGAIGENQVCVIKTQNVPNYRQFSENNGRVLIFEGSAKQQAKLLVVCDRQNKLDGTIADYKYDEKYGINTEIDSCNFPSTTESIVCLVAVVST